jgi:hypothetical protein
VISRGHVRRKMSRQEEVRRARESAMTHSPDLTPQDRDRREEVVHTDLARRLKGVCGDMGKDDFEALLVQMTSEQLRGERYRRM